MNEALAHSQAAIELVVRLSLPVLGAAFLVALVTALGSTWSRLADPALSALPRALVTLLVLSSTGAFIARGVLGYALGLFRALPDLVR